jgi:hypothetical protein
MGTYCCRRRIIVISLNDRDWHRCCAANAREQVALHEQADHRLQEAQTTIRDIGAGGFDSLLPSLAPVSE